jgi:hypothetical protein
MYQLTKALFFKRPLNLRIILFNKYFNYYNYHTQFSVANSWQDLQSVC